MNRTRILFLTLSLALSVSAIPPLEALKLIIAYPDHLSHYSDDGYIVWQNGTQMIWDDGKAKDFDQMLEDADLEDQMSQPYKKSLITKERKKNFDPGRIRHTPFFTAMYGETESDVDFNMVEIDWFGEKLMVTTVNGIDERLREISDELKQYKKYLHPSAGTYNFRVIAGTDRLSCHSFGIAIDINIDVSRYWRWDKDWNIRQSHISIPDEDLIEIVKVFERHGFIWGGRWYHYDSMHFEYRPELLQ